MILLINKDKVWEKVLKKKNGIMYTKILNQWKKPIMLNIIKIFKYA